MGAIVVLVVGRAELGVVLAPGVVRLMASDLQLPLLPVLLQQGLEAGMVAEGVPSRI